MDFTLVSYSNVISQATAITATDEFSLHSMYWYRSEHAKKEISAFMETGEPFSMKIDEKLTTQHYFGHIAVDYALSLLQLPPSAYILDAGAGMGAVSRYVAQKTPNSSVLSVDINSDFIEIANDLTAQLGGFEGRLTHIVEDLLTIKTDVLFDAVISFLCFLHIGDKDALFSSLSNVVKLDGRMYFEDFISPDSPVSAESTTQLMKYVSCPHLLPKDAYVAAMETHGFKILSFEDVTDIWSEFTESRAVNYRAELQQHVALHGHEIANAYLDFYVNMAELFQKRAVVGVRVLVQKKENPVVA
eukprot:gene28811-37819_t